MITKLHTVTDTIWAAYSSRDDRGSGRRPYWSEHPCE